MRGAGTRTVATLAAVAAIVLPIAGCGDEQTVTGAPEGVPAAGEFTPPSGTPGVPDGASYDLDGHGWLQLTQAQQSETANDYIADNPDRCDGADVGAVVDYVSASYDFDFPLEIEASEVLAEGCDASLQS